VDDFKEVKFIMAELRMPFINFVIVAGRVVNEPDLRYTSKGVAFARFRLAIPKRFKTKDEWKEETTFIDVRAWGNLAERVKDKLSKGNPVIIEGELRSRTFEDTETSKKRTVVELIAKRVQFLEKIPVKEAGLVGEEVVKGEEEGLEGEGEDIF